MKLLDSTSIIDDTLKNFNMNFSGYQDNVKIIRKFDINAKSIISLRKNDFTDWVFALMLVYQKKAMSFDEFRRTLECLLEISVHFTAGDFNCDLGKVSSNELLDHINQGIYPNPK